MANRLQNFVKIFIPNNSIKLNYKPTRLQTSPTSRVLRKRNIVLNQKMPKTKPSYYAVRIGRKPGIYKTWDECQDQINKYPNSRYKKFFTLKEAQDFLFVSSHASQDLDFVDNSVSRLVVWTDGCSLNNGRDGARAGVGVFWGDNHPRYIIGDKQTNNRAEITAVIRALETCPDRELPIEIKTDSKYTINAYESWIPKWIKNGWKTADKKPVENKDLFIRLIELIETRPGKVTFTYVPGHVGIPGNEAADRLANIGALKENVEAVKITKQNVQNSLMNFTEDDLFSSEELAAIAAEIHSSH
ncbi:3611_t:CDS:2 [Dentiscutata heterogama]|uniref:3611_t:CDS:1 n=1 Tax=Dentiscutata heterogama TaxID=1316150 RepID=A0ACA9KVY8_9GLOM|nr:3611_t:CDS:2 [Dentiscutata heterogama]